MTSKAISVKLVLTALSVGVLGMGCNRTPGPPAPLGLTEIPGALTKAYLSASPDAKELAGKVIGAIQGKDYPEAYEETQLLCSAPGETKDQRLLATRVMLTLTSLLRDAQNQGDPQAAAALKVYQMTR